MGREKNMERILSVKCLNKLMMKKIMLLFCLGFILSSCVKEPLSEAGIGTKDETYITLGLKVPTSVTPTRAGSPKDTYIKDIAILIFDEETKEYLYGSNNIKPVSLGDAGTITFTAKVLVTNKPVLIHVFANSQGQINPDNYKNSKEEMALASVASMDLNSDQTTALPMHGLLGLPKITILGSSANVTLCRSVARVDVKVANEVKNFSLQKLYAYFTPSKGRFVQNTKNTKPNLPASLDKKTFSTVEQGYVTSIENQLFIYENINTLNPEGSTRIVVKGAYTAPDMSNSTVSFYPIDFANPEGTELIDILRNHQYIFNITKVSSYGYETADEASKGSSANITAEIRAWNQNDHNDIVFDGANYFSVEKKMLTIKGDAGVKGSLSVESSINSNEWEMKWKNSGTTYSNASSISSSLFKVTKPSSSYSGLLTFQTLKPYSAANCEDILEVKVRNLKMQFTVKQSNSNEHDYKLGDFYPNKDLNTATGVVVHLSPLSILGGFEGHLDYPTAKRRCEGKNESLPEKSYFSSIPDTEIDSYYGKNLYKYCRKTDSKNDARFWTGTRTEVNYMATVKFEESGKKDPNKQNDKGSTFETRCVRLVE